METREGPHISRWIKSNGEEEIEILWLKGKMENFTSLHPLRSEISQVCKFSKAYMDAKNLKWEDEIWPRWECHKQKLEDEGLKQKEDKSTLVVATTTTDTFNSSKIYSPFSLRPVPISI